MSYYTRQQNRRRSEATEQETLIQWCGWQQSKYPELKLIYHIPNGGSRNTLEAANLKRQGVKAGVPDLCLPVARNGFHGLYIEMKYGKNNGEPEGMAGRADGAGVFYGGLLRGRGSGKDNCTVFAVSGLSCDREPGNTKGGLKHGNRYAGI